MYHLLRVEVLRAIRVFLEELPAAMTKKLMVCHLNFEGARIPLVVECSIVRVDECQFLICA